MGIPGLKPFLNRIIGAATLSTQSEDETTVIDSIAMQVVPKGSTLLIDASGFMFWMVQNSKLDRIQFSVLGGVYSQLDKVFEDEIIKLTKEYEFDISFVFDGSAPVFKETALMKRQERREEELHRFWTLCTQYQNAKLPLPGAVDAAGLPFPALCMIQLRSTVARLGIDLCQAKEEADRTIALMCHKVNKKLAPGKSPLFYCYGNDTDFIALKDCPYIEFGDLFTSASGEIVAGKLWKRSSVAARLGLTENAFVELCLLAGNDYTAGFDPKQLENLSDIRVFDESAPEIGSDRLSTLYNIIRNQSSDFQLKSVKSVDYENALRFSRAFYQLDDYLAASFENSAAEADIMSSSDDEEEAISASGKASNPIPFELTMNEKRLLDERIQSIPALAKPGGGPNGSEQLPDARATGLYALMILKEISSSRESAHRAPVIAAGHHVDHQQPFSAIQSIHLQALERMFQLSSSSASQEDNGEVRVPVWTDVLAANMYQKVCHHVLRKMLHALEFKSFDLYKQWAPAMLYDGIAFHTSLRALRNAKQEQGKAEVKKKIESVGVAQQQPQTPQQEQQKKSSSSTGSQAKRKQNSNNKIKAPLSTAATTVGASPSPSLPPPDDVPLTHLQNEAEAREEQDEIVFKAAAAKQAPVVVEERLPIEDHREKVLASVARSPVTIIHGETGCGKSSKIPVYLYEQARKSRERCKIIISQPRRLATHSLLKRLRPTLGTKVGMRMGYNTRDEFADTCIWLVTTGYLVQLLAAYPNYLSSHGITHLIIDEVHERSVDSDVLVFLAKKALMQSLSASSYNTDDDTLRLILMSATANGNLYKDYFSDLCQPNYMFVGARRFPVREYFLDDMPLDEYIEKHAPAPMNLVHQMSMQFASLKQNQGPPAKLVKQQISLACNLIRVIAEPGSAILVFVSGMQDISDIFDELEQDAKHRLQLFACHSEIPFEEQTAMFEPLSDQSRVRVIIATNSAESSITLTDVDVVIDLGIQKELCYESEFHGTQLEPVFISHSSATQRAGRTGRVRPGRVVRLYTQTFYRTMMRLFDTPEIHRIPLDDSILTLRSSFERNVEFTGVVPILNSLIEPPDMSKVDRSYSVLHRDQMISEPDDTGKLTTLGKLCTKLKVGTRMCRLIAMGILMNVGAETLILAAAMNQPKTCFRTTNRVFHTDPRELHEILRLVLVNSLRFDGEMFSEPIMMLQLFKIWSIVPHEKKAQYAVKHGLVMSRLKLFIANAKSLLESAVQNGLKVNLDSVQPDKGLVLDKQHVSSFLDLTPKTVNTLRLLLVWNSDGALARLKPGLYHKNAFGISLEEGSGKKPMINKEGQEDFQINKKLLESELLPPTLQWRGSKLSWKVLSPPNSYRGRLNETFVSLTSPEELLVKCLTDFSAMDLPDVFGVMVRKNLVLAQRMNCPGQLSQSHLDGFLPASSETKFVQDPTEGLIRGYLLSSFDTSARTTQAAKGLVARAVFDNLKTHCLHSFESALFVRVDDELGQSHVWQQNSSFGIVKGMMISEKSSKHSLRKIENESSSIMFVPSSSLASPTESPQRKYEFCDSPLDYKLLCAYIQAEKKNLDKIIQLGESQASISMDLEQSKWTPCPIRTVVLKNQGQKNEICHKDPIGLEGKAHTVMNSSSLASVTVHAVPAESVYSVAGNRMKYGQSIGLEMNTILPPGDKWVSLALRCIGWKSRITEMFDNANPNLIKSCDLVFELLRGKLEEETIIPCEELQARIQSLFNEFETVDFHRKVDPAVLALPSPSDKNDESILPVAAPTTAAVTPSSVSKSQKSILAPRTVLRVMAPVSGSPSTPSTPAKEQAVAATTAASGSKRVSKSSPSKQTTSPSKSATKSPTKKKVVN